ncbi:MAG TPA: enoyl-ACP reductase [bacterium]|nr:enoyl-ACP reductase [bacterium]
MGLMEGKNVAIFGVANKRSIAWGIAQALQREGAKLAFSYQNERMGDAVKKLVADLPEEPFLAPCDVTVEGDIEKFFAALGEHWDGLDGIVHSIAFAKRDELGGNFRDTSWDGYALAQQVSSWSLIGLVKGGMPMMEGRNASVVCLSYYGAEKVVTNYNVMGVAKAALESSTRYLANDVGPSGVRVNAISAGPIKTVSAMGVGDFGTLLDSMAQKAPLRRNVDQMDVGNTAAFLLSPLANGITGQTIYVDAGYSILGV